MHGRFAGVVEETDEGFHFVYDQEYAGEDAAPPISLTLPKRSDPYRSASMIPFFDGLIPEGWMLDIAADQWKLDPRDRMGLLLTVCEDPIGAVQVFNDTTNE
jgi:serine/threonine-protein kinase HipA